MQWKRSYPLPTPINRSYIVDNLERVYTPNYDQSPVFKTAGESFILLEWDIALSREDMAEFESRAIANPHDIQVLPYKLYGSSGHYVDNVVDSGSWVHRRITGAAANPIPGQHRLEHIEAISGNKDWVTYGTPFVHMFGFGAIYFPYEIVREYCHQMFDGVSKRTSGNATRNDNYPVVTDHFFSMWHWLETGNMVKCHWDIMPIHLHW